MPVSSRRLSVLSQHLTAVPTSIEFHSVNHIARATENVDAMVKFYCDVMGFRVITRPPFPFGGAWLRNGNMMLHLIKPSEMKNQDNAWLVNQMKETKQVIDKYTNDTPGNISKTKAVRAGTFLSGIGNHLAFRVDSIKDAETHLESCGVQYYAFDHEVAAAKGKNDFSKQMTAGGTEKQIFLYDPDGNGLEISNFGDDFPEDDPTGTSVNPGGKIFAPAK